MNIIHPTRIYKHKISELSNLVVELPSFIQNHTNVISPIEVSCDSNATYLHYSVSVKGMTLREFVKPKQPIRNTLFNSLHRNHPIDIILQLIDAYDFMTNHNMLVGQPNINPDCIWIERNASGEVKASVMNTLETEIHDKYRIVDDNQQYWSSDYISEYHNVNYYNQDFNHKPIFTRCDTKLSSNHIVYSLGLILYFIVEHHNPYPEGRVNPTERPYFTAHCSTKYKTYITLATEPNPKKRTKLMEWKCLLQQDGARASCSVS